MLGITIRRKARQFGTLVRHSALTARTGVTRKPVLARRGELGVTFIGHSSFFLQIGGKNILVDPNFARWIFVLKRLRRPGLKLRELPAIDAVLVSHAHFDHLHRPSLRAIAWLTRRETGERLKPEVALLPIGAYHPDSFRRVHTSPEDAVQGFLDLGARWMVPMHYGTFRLSYEPVDEPVERLKADAKRRGIERKICVLEEGVTKFFE